MGARRAGSVRRSRCGGTTYATYRQWAAALAHARRQFARLMPAGRSGRDRHDQSAGISRSAVRHLARGAGRGADERQAPQRGIRLHHRQYGSGAGPGQSRSRRRCRGARPHHRDRQRRVAAAFQGDGIDVVPRQPERSRLALLHQRHDRPAQRRDADARHHDGADASLFRRDRAGPAGRLRPSCRADVAWLRLLRPALRRHGRKDRHSRKRRLRSGRDRRATVDPRQCQFLRGADHGQPLDQSCRLRRRRSSAACAPSSMAARRCISKRCCAAWICSDRNSRKSTARAKCP